MWYLPRGILLLLSTVYQQAVVWSVRRHQYLLLSDERKFGIFSAWYVIAHKIAFIGEPRTHEREPCTSPIS